MCISNDTHHVSAILCISTLRLINFLRKTRQDHALSRMTAIWLLPVVTLIVASSSGGILASALAPISLYHALITLTLSAFMVSVGLCLAFMILTIYILRLIAYGLPQGASVISVFIPLGPMGQGGYSILLLGQGFREILPLHKTSEVLSNPATGEIMDVLCVAVAFILWSLGTMWLLYALLACAEVFIKKERFSFKLPVWGLIFPNVSTIMLLISHYRNRSIRLDRGYMQTSRSSSLVPSAPTLYESGARPMPQSLSLSGRSSSYAL